MGKLLLKEILLTIKKNGYWYYYDLNGKLVKEGHYIESKPSEWWKFYYKKINSFEECLYQEDGITRFCLYYIDNKLKKACKYRNDTFIKQWTTISSFKNDNPHFKF